MEDQYYNGKNTDSIPEDDRYDELKKIYDERVPEEPLRVGAPVSFSKKKKLPYYMGSLDKIKDSQPEALEKWKTKHKYNKNNRFLVEQKLDGVSALYIHEPNKGHRLYTRGDGTHGTDISGLIGLLNLPPLPKGVAVRGEILMKHPVFLSKYAERFKNARNLVSGMINAKTPCPTTLGDASFIAYEVLSGNPMAPSQQLCFLQEMGLETVENRQVTGTELTCGQLSKWLDEFRAGPFPTDGLVLVVDEPYTVSRNGNPTYAMAYKKNVDKAMAVVKQVLWSVSKNGFLKPRIEIEPVDLCGAQISFLTGFNAKYINDHKIGQGAILEITRSGDVIPHILDVVQEGKLVDPPYTDLTWSDTGVDLVVTDKNNKESLVKKIHFFFKTLEIKQIAEKSIEKIVGACVGCSIPYILAMTVEDFRGIGFGPIESQNFWQEIHMSGKLDNVPLHVLMTASGVFGNGIGLKKIQKITGVIPNVLLEETKNKDKLVSKIATLSGWTAEGAQDFVEQLPEFRRFLSACPMIKVESPATKTTYETSIQYSVVFSGFRDSELEKQLATQGIQVVSTLTKGVRYLVVKDDSVTTSKTEKARQLGVAILSREKFIKLL